MLIWKTQRVLVGFGKHPQRGLYEAKTTPPPLRATPTQPATHTLQDSRTPLGLEQGLAEITLGQYSSRL
jgi:hypothetical protein